MSDIQKELRLKGQVAFGERILLYGGEWMLLRKGDTYLAQAKGEPPEFLTVRRVEVQKRNTGEAEGRVFSKERNKKLYKLHEVMKVTFIDNPNFKKADEDERDTTTNNAERTTSGRAKRGKHREDHGRTRENRPVPRPPANPRPTNYAANRRDDE